MISSSNCLNVFLFPNTKKHNVANFRVIIISECWQMLGNKNQHLGKGHSFSRNWGRSSAWLYLGYYSLLAYDLQLHIEKQFREGRLRSMFVANLTVVSRWGHHTGNGGFVRPHRLTSTKCEREKRKPWEGLEGGQLSPLFLWGSPLTRRNSEYCKV